MPIPPGTCNQRETLTGTALAYPVVTNKPAQRQISTSELRHRRLQPNRGHAVPPQEAETPALAQHRTPVHHKHPIELRRCLAVRRLTERAAANELGGPAPWQWLALASHTCVNTTNETGTELRRVPGALVPLVATTRGPGAAWRSWNAARPRGIGSGVPASTGLPMGIVPPLCPCDSPGRSRHFCDPAATPRPHPKPLPMLCQKCQEIWFLLTRDLTSRQWEWWPKSIFWVLPFASGRPKCPSRGLKAWVPYPVL